MTDFPESEGEMGIPTLDNRQTNDEEVTKLLEGEHEATQNFHILYRVNIKTFVRREAAANEVTYDTVWDAHACKPNYK